MTAKSTSVRNRIGIGMAETTEKTGEKTLSVAPTKTLTLKGRGVEQGVVRQSFSHGRTKAVVVEKVKSRVPTRAKVEAPNASASPAAKRPVAPAQHAPAPAPTQAPHAPKPAGGLVLRSLTDEEQKARVHALNDARLREAEERKIAEEEAVVRKSREAVERAERDAAEARKADEEKRRKHDLETKQKAEQEAKKRFGEDAATPGAPRPVAARPALEPDEEEAPRTRRGPGGAARPAPAPKPARTAPQKSRGRLTLVTALSADEERERSVAAFRRRTQRLKGHAADEPKEKLVREVIIPETITIQELANRMAERGVDVIKLLMKQGHMAQINDVIDADTAQLIAEELGHSVKRVAEADVEEGVFDSADDPATLIGLAADGIAIGITGENIARRYSDRVVSFRIDGLRLRYSLALAWSDRGPHTRAMASFLDFAAVWLADWGARTHAESLTSVEAIR